MYIQYIKIIFVNVQLVPRVPNIQVATMISRSIYGRVRSIGHYDKEEDAAISYAKAAFKYKPKKGSQQIFGGLDLSNIPEQQELISHLILVVVIRV